MLSCFEDILRASAPPPPPPIPSVLSPVPPGSGRRSVSSATVSPARPSAPLQAPLPPDTPGSVMMEDDPPLCVPDALHIDMSTHSLLSSVYICPATAACSGSCPT